MPFDTQELSQYGGQPSELFHFRNSVGQTVFALTTGEDEFADGLTLYVPGVINRTSVRQTTEDPSSSLEIRVANDSTIAQQFKAYLPSKPINLLIYRFHANDSGMERRTIFIGQVVSVSFGNDGIATINCDPVTKSRGKKVPWQVYKKGCNWALYEHGCGVLRALFETPVLSYVTSGDTITAAVFAEQEDTWYSNGYIERVVNGERRYITGHVGTDIQLDYPFFDLDAGEALIAVAGCSRTEEVCRDKFDNLINYLGWDYIPEENPYDTNFGPAETPPPPLTPVLGPGLIAAGGG
jgi:uncharacterized phage protein (TIGR02218 family)